MIHSMDPTSSGSERMRRMKRALRQIYMEEFESKYVRLAPIRAKGVIIFSSIVAIVAFIITTFYNFNIFVDLEEKIFAASGLIEVSLQHRTDLVENLVILTLNQSALEQEVFRHIADVRASIGDMDTTMVQNSPMPEMVTNAPSLVAPLANMLGIVEQYPKISSAVTYQQLMDKLVEIEDRLIKSRDTYNLEVRTYNQLITSFPWWFLAYITGFERHAYFSTADNLKLAKWRVTRIDANLFQRLLPIREPGVQGSSQ
ncbi:MAG: LemA family protein [Magnetococcus sp. DMHC-6]